jgi:Bacterial capsule synthesis protein PGA_cap
MTMRSVIPAAAAALVLTLGSEAHAQSCWERPTIEPGANCNTSISPNVGVWDALSWGTRTVVPNTCNPTGLVGMPPAKVLTTVRNKATEKRIVLFGDLMAAPEERVPVVHDELKSLFRSADLIVGNLEAPITASTCWWSDYNPSGTADKFQISRDYLTRLFNAYGIAGNKAVVTVANNHGGDLAEAGARATAAVTTNLVQTGALKGVVGLSGAGGAPKLSVHDFGNLRVGVVGWTEIENCKLVVDGKSPWTRGTELDGLDLRAEKQRLGIDLMLGAVHWGEDFYYFPDADTRARARALQARGMDVIAGSHPHVLQPAEQLAPGDLAFYSLASLNLNWALKEHTLIPVVELLVSEAGAVVEYKVHAFAYKNLSSPSFIPCRSACGGGWDVDACLTDWSVIPLRDVSNFWGARSALEDELYRVFPR